LGLGVFASVLAAAPNEEEYDDPDDDERGDSANNA